MQRIISISLMVMLLGLVILCAGCGPRSVDVTREDVTKQPGYVYGSGTGQSINEQLAIDSAKHNARLEIAEQVEARVKQFLQEAGVESAVVSEAKTSVTLSGCKVLEEEVKKEGPIYQVYVRMEMPVEEADVALVAKVKANEDLHNRLKASQAFKELEREVKEYRKKKWENTKYLYGTGRGWSMNQQMAIDDAKHGARLEIAEQVRTRIEAFLEQTDARSTAVSEEEVSVTLVGCETVKEEIKQEGRLYRAYVEMRMPVEGANAALVAEVKANEDLHNRLRELQEFKELVKQVEEYQQKKEKKTPLAREEKRPKLVKQPALEGGHMEECKKNLEKINQAIAKYKEEHGVLPNWLSDLYPKYLSDPDGLICPADTSEPKGSRLSRSGFRPFLQDPEMPCSYVYQFTPARGYREQKGRQLKEFGDKVPMVRCLWHISRSGYPVINLSHGGEIYLSGTNWEKELREKKLEE
jgi:hypothetical protein